jgi:hypothetical protein
LAVRTVHLPLLDHVHGLDSGDGDPGAPKGLESEYRAGGPLDGPVVLLDNVVQILFWRIRMSTQASALTFNGRRVGAALVNGDLLRHIVQVDCSFQKATRRGQIALGGEQGIDCVPIAINSEVEVLPLAGHFDVGLVHSPTPANWSLRRRKTATNTGSILIIQRCTVA